MANYVYARVSTGKQEYDSQIIEINQYFEGANNPLRVSDMEVVTEKLSGDSDLSIRELQSLVDRCVDGDIIYIAKSTRWSRQAVTGIYLLQVAWNKGVKVFNCDQRSIYDMSDTRALLWYFADFLGNQNNLKDIRKGTAAGVKNAQRKGKKFGRSNPNYTVNPEKQAAGMVKARTSKVMARLKDPQLDLIIKAVELMFEDIVNYRLPDHEFPFLGYGKYRRITTAEWVSIHRNYQTISSTSRNAMINRELSVEAMKDQYYYIYRTRFKVSCDGIVKL